MQGLPRIVSIFAVIVAASAPPYLARVGASLFVLLILGLPLLAIAALVSRFTRLPRLAAVWALIIAAGALVAALDARNAAGWNPTLYGSFFVAASLPATLWLAAPRPHRVAAAVMGGMAMLPIILLIAAVGPVFVLWARAHGLPAGW